MGGSLKNLDWLKEIKSRFKTHREIQCFVETGTYYGGTTFMAASLFEEVHTVEISEKFYQNAIIESKKRKIDNIFFHHGDSGEIIYQLCQNIKQPSVFFLDGHYCGKGRDGEQSPNGNPLLKEVDAINKRGLSDIIIIDDTWLFGKKFPEKSLDWSNITESSILSKIDKHRILSTQYTDDRFIVFLKGV